MARLTARSVKPTQSIASRPKPAPAHHFDGLPGLLSAIVARGFAIFARTMLDELGSAGPDARARLIAICDGYLKFVPNTRTFSP